MNRNRLMVATACAVLVASAACGSKSTKVTPSGQPKTSGSSSSAGSPPAAGAPVTLPAGLSTVAEVPSRASSIGVFRAAGDKTPYTRLSNPNEDGAPRVFLVTQRQGEWLQVLLPVRPNGTRGWIRAADVGLSQHDYRVRIELSGHRITVWRGAQVVDQEPIGVGRGNTPTPGGDYYITELLEQPNPNGPYGPYAYGLSGYSEVLKTFAGADGVIGLHGTNDPSGLGHDVSHGCIRMSNAGITKLAHMLPLGTPVTIVA
jgi:lipoprotein-anchoring transpeptidase ErfK/SrfK